MNKQAVLDVLNSLEVVESQGGDDAYALVDVTDEMLEELAAVGISRETALKYGDDTSICILALAFGEGYANYYCKKLVNWPEEAVELIDELSGTSVESPPFGSYAAHQPNYEGFKKLGKLDDYVYQSLSHLGNASHHISWGLTVLEHTDVPKDLQEEIRQAGIAIHKLQDKLRAHQSIKG